jgi:hypothetical protein
MRIMPKARVIRRTVIDMAVRRQRRGYGSQLSSLEKSTFVQPWWRDAEAALAQVPHVVIRAAAANAYMAPRFTQDLDVGVLPADLELAEAALEAAGWRRGQPTEPTDPHLRGRTWRSHDGHEVDLFEMHHPWAAAALRETRPDPRTGLPTLPVPYVVLMKMTVSRMIDMADLTRVLGGRSDTELEGVRAAVRRFGATDDLDDLEQLIALGRLERDDR